jgi:serine/threonine-protein kinase RsbT
MVDEVRVPVASDLDIVVARAEGRRLALDLGFSKTDATLVATAISEVARNILTHAREGVITISTTNTGEIAELTVVASDDGPGIPDVEQALRDGYSTIGSLGLGLPGARRLVDEFEIESQDGKGTEVVMRKWRRL